MIYAALAIALLLVVWAKHRQHEQRRMRADIVARLGRGRPAPANLSRRSLVGYLRANGFNPRA